MISVYTDVLQFRGTHYYFGVYQGKKLLNSPYFQNRTELYKRLQQKHIVDVPYIQSLLEQFAPQLMDEIQGLADTLQFDLPTAYLHFAGYYANIPSGCSIFMDNDYMIRNYDNAPSTYDGRFVFFAPTDDGYATIGPTMQITGRMDGLNEHGLALGYNFVNTKHNGDGFVCNMISRIVLQTCRNVSEAVVLLKRLPHKHAFNYCLLDASGTSIVVEASARRVETVDSLVCTNHFRVITEENRYRMEDSLARVEKMTDAKLSTMSFREAYQLMNEPDAGVFATKYGAWDGTLHTACYMPKSLMVTFTIGSNAMVLPIDFKQWVQGTNVLYSKFKGQLDAKETFANM